MPLLKRKIEDFEDEEEKNENEPQQEQKDNESTNEHKNKKIKNDTHQELINDNININENICTICLDNLKENNYVKTNCNHTFCLSCLLQHLKFNNTCPCCRSSIESIRKNDSKQLSLNDVSNLIRLNIEQNQLFLSQVSQEIKNNFVNSLLNNETSNVNNDIHFQNKLLNIITPTGKKNETKRSYELYIL
jgi:flagellar biosynthesis GTPase FlhF